MAFIWDHYFGALIGQCLGEALALPMLDQTWERCRSYAGGEPMGLMGSSGRPFGQYGPASQLTREMWRSFREGGGWLDGDDWALRLAWLVNEDLLVGGGGSATREAARRISGGTSWKRSGVLIPHPDCAGAARAAPLGLIHLEDSERIVQSAVALCRATHTDRQSCAGAMAVALMVAEAAQRGSLRKRGMAGFTDSLLQWVTSWDPMMAKGIATLHRWPQLPLKEALHWLGEVVGREGGVNCLREQGLSGGVAEGVLWSLHAFLRSPSDFMSAIRIAIWGGGDPLAQAAMTGAIAGAYLGWGGLGRGAKELSRQLSDHGEWGLQPLLGLASDGFYFVSPRVTSLWERTYLDEVSDMEQPDPTRQGEGCYDRDKLEELRRRALARREGGVEG